MRLVVAVLLSFLFAVPAYALNTVRLTHQVVRVMAFTKDGKGGITGAGFAIDKENLLTAGHFCADVVEHKDDLDQRIAVSFLNANDEISTIAGGQIAKYIFDEAEDLCVIHLPRHGLVPMKIANYDNVKIGQKVYTIGAPLGFMFPSITDGYVSQKYSEGFPAAALNNKLLTTIPVFGGNSGGPVVNESGEVIGVLVMSVGAYEHSSFAVTADMIRFFLEGK